MLTSIAIVVIVCGALAFKEKSNEVFCTENSVNSTCLLGLACPNVAINITFGYAGRLTRITALR
jgi:hypothetical protein